MSMLKQTFDLLEEAINNDRLDVARQLAAKVSGDVRRTRDAELVRTLTDINRRLRERAAGLKKLDEAEKKLKEDPNDAEANLAVGMHLCLIKDDWKTRLAAFRQRQQ